MAEKKKMYTGDLKPDYSADLSDVRPDGTNDPAFSLASALSVRVVGTILLPNAAAPVPLFDRPASTISGSTVTMLWEVGDTSRVGTIRTEVEVMWAGSKPQTFRPPEIIQVVQDFGGAATSA